MVLTCLRWVIVVLVLLPLVGRQVVAAWPLIRERWRLHDPHGSLRLHRLQRPVLRRRLSHDRRQPHDLPGRRSRCSCSSGTVLFFRARVVPLQVVGMIVTIARRRLVAVKGDLEILRTLALNIGDVWM